VAVSLIRATTNQACGVIKTTDTIINIYLFYFLSFNYKEMRELSNSGSQKNLSLTILSALSIPLPPMREQKRIAEILSTWDEAIETTEKLIAAQEQRKKWLMQ